MGLKVNCVFVLVFVVSVVNCLPKPRDSTILHSENVIKTEVESTQKNLEESSTAKADNPETFAPGRITCEHIEATEDTVCEEHCIPKGYAYGLCVSKICSCV